MVTLKLDFTIMTQLIEDKFKMEKCNQIKERQRKNSNIHPLQAMHQSVVEELEELWRAVSYKKTIVKILLYVQYAVNCTLRLHVATPQV